MGVGLNWQCMLCHLRKNTETARGLGDDKTATEFAKALMKLYMDAPGDAAAPWLAPGTTALFQQFYGLEADRYREEKAASNAFALARLDTVRSRIENAEEPLYRALQFALLGNYIDFSALHKEVSFTKLDEMLEKAGDMAVERASYDALCRELETRRTLLYLTDNAGEIAFDRLLAEQIKKTYPHIAITFCVRGGPALNDATREDAAAVGIRFPVIDNGTGIPGMYLPLLSAEAKQAMDTSDVILAKGQANVETLLGSGYPIFYAFLVKCDRFISTFQKPKLTPMLLREGKLSNY